mmetsp:Transcript_77113/g.249583  ORF Transcript_77113/g.249583 Transcript_77113/m.249583 type:complete len:137 (+) Transcript_77113:73-483(+)
MSAGASTLALLLLIASSTGPAFGGRVALEVAPREGGAWQVEEDGRDGFDDLDLNGDGIVTRAEWEQVVEAAVAETAAISGGDSGNGASLVEEQGQQAAGGLHCCRCRGKLASKSNCREAKCEFVHGGGLTHRGCSK